MLALGVIQPHARLEYLPPRVSLVTSSADDPKKTKWQLAIHVSKKACIVSNLTSSCVQAHLKQGPDLASITYSTSGIGHFPGPPYHLQVNTSITPNQTPCRPIPVHLKEPFKQEIDKMLQAGLLKPVHQVTPWINNFVLVEDKDKLGKLKLRIWLELHQSK